MATHEHLTDACPPLSDLLLADTRELPADDLRRIGDHMSGCDTCRLRMRRTHALLAACAALDVDEPSSAFSHRQSLVRWKRLAIAAAAAVLLAGIGGTLINPQRLRAEELLDRAIEAEQRAPAAREQHVRIQITLSAAAASRGAGGTRPAAPLVVTRRLAGGVAVSRPGSAIEDSDVYAELLGGLRAYGFDTQRPLNLQTYRMWRAKLTQRREVVERNEDTTTLRTTTDEGAVRRAELTIRTETYDVVALRLTFDAGRLEVVEIRRSDAPLRDPSPDPDPVASASASSSRPTVPTPTPQMGVVDRDPRPSSNRPALSRWLAQKYSSASEGQQFVARLESLTGDIQRNLAELRKLAASSPQAVTDRMTPDERADVERAALAYLDKARTDLAALDDRLGLMFLKLGRPASPRGTSLPADWRERAPIALVHASALDALVKQLLMHDDVRPDDDPAGADAFAKTLAALWGALNGAGPGS
jgi:hypothetical protein